MYGCIVSPQVEAVNTRERFFYYGEKSMRRAGFRGCSGGETAGLTYAPRSLSFIMID